MKQRDGQRSLVHAMNITSRVLEIVEKAEAPLRAMAVAAALPDVKKNTVYCTLNRLAAMGLVLKLRQPKGLRDRLPPVLWADPRRMTWDCSNG